MSTNKQMKLNTHFLRIQKSIQNSLQTQTEDLKL